MEARKLQYGKVIEQDGERVYVKHVDRAKHYMRIYKAWGFQKNEIARMNQLNVSKVVLYVKYEGAYETDIDNVNKGLEGNFGHGNQKFVSDERFKKVNP